MERADDGTRQRSGLLPGRVLLAASLLAAGLAVVGVHVLQPGPTSATPQAAAALEDLSALTMCAEGPGPTSFGIASMTPTRTVRILSVGARVVEKARVLGVRVGEPPGSIDFGVLRGFPPAHAGYGWELTAPAEDAVLQAGRRYNLVVGVDLLPGSDIGVVNGLDVQYLDGDARRTWVVPHLMAVASSETTCGEQQQYLDRMAAVRD